MDTNSRGLVVLEEKVTSGVDVGYPGVDQQPKMCNICVMGTSCQCDGEAFCVRANTGCFALGWKEERRFGGKKGCSERGLSV